jgi:Tol biopolymer transport system component
VVKADGEPVFVVTGASKPQWSPTGDRVAVEREGGIEVRDAAGTPGPVIASAENAAWAPGGGSMAVMKMTGETGVPVIVDLASGGETALSGDIEPHAPTFPFAWHPQGLVLGYRDRLYEPSTGNQQNLPGVPISWSPDGRTLMVAYTTPSDTGGTTVRLLDGSQDLKEVIGLDVPPSSQGIPGWEFVQIWTDWTPNGRFLVFMDPTPGREQVRVYDAHEYRQYRYSDTKGELPEVSPDNSVVVYMQDGKVWLMATDGSFLKNELAEGTRPAWLPIASP